ncbi:activity-regulated cytoskeleton-associated protein-like [Bacillus rossius redtenbacheri]|uniref:activity-regulated cytoskeleton-associated protein-like n=1 Tax=Bacillus rossius redtenbacheri TaxID=93214 RepID=UPI002FDDA5F3
MCATCEGKVNSPAPVTVVNETRRDNIRVKLPEFSGHPYEDPEKFTRACQDRLARYGVPQEEWTECVTEQLRGPATDRWAMTGEYGVEWEDFAPRLEARFNAARARAQCQRALFCEPQRADEDVETFIRSKMRLHRRLDAGGPVNAALDVTVELMKRELRLHLWGAVDRELEDFVQLAKEIERDLRLSPRPRDTAARRRGASPSPRTAPEDEWAVVPYVNPPPPPGATRRGAK